MNEVVSTPRASRRLRALAWRGLALVALIGLVGCVVRVHDHDHGYDHDHHVPPPPPYYGH